MINLFKKNFLLVFLISLLINTSITLSEEIKKLPKHHLKDGTFVNTNGIGNDKKFKDFLKWTTDRKDKKAVPIDFEVVEPDFNLINQSEQPFAITWIGHASFLYQNKDLNILTDPHLTKRASPISFAGPKRYTKVGMKLEELPPIDLVTISHNHYDHLDLKSVKWIAKKNPNAVFLVPLGVKQWFLNQSIENVIELDWWDQYQMKNTQITFTPVQHWSSRTIFDRNQSLWGGWFIKNNDHSLIHLGDTGYTNDFKEINKKLGAVDLALIPIGAYAPRWFMKFSHMNPSEAVQSFLDLEATKAVGMHWGAFILTDEPVDEPPKMLEEELVLKSIDKKLFITMKHGETIDLNNYQE
jgi:L-ascorbate metabolism protein UlaG (beta-lactamase superfamily)|tara:strand:+ start:97 stop:1158 length:1062 start_codon:yes stop_codon:yes gene_type:complete